MYFKPILMTQENVGAHIKKDAMILRNQHEILTKYTPFSLLIRNFAKTIQ